MWLGKSITAAGWLGGVIANAITGTVIPPIPEPVNPILVMDYATFILIYPQFSSPSLRTTVIRQLMLSEKLLSETAWEDFYQDAIGLDSAHNLVLSMIAGSSTTGAIQAASGLITSVSGAGISTSFQGMHVNDKSMSEQWYSKTIYGQQFLRLRNAVIPFGMMAA